MQEHYVGSELLFLFCVCLVWLFFLKRLDCLFGLSLFFMVAMCHQGGEDAHTGNPWRHARNLLTVPPAVPQVLEQRSQPSAAGLSRPWPALRGTGWVPVPRESRTAAAGTGTARSSTPHVSMVFAATVLGPNLPLPS